MGMYATAILAYGYVWSYSNNNDIVSGNSTLEWQEVLAKKFSHTNPWDNFPKEFDRLPYLERDAASKQWIENHRAEINEWTKVKDDLENWYKVEVSYHCSSDDPMTYLAIKDIEFRAYQGDPVLVPDLEINPEWDAWLQRFMTDLDIDLSESKGPGWFLASHYG